MTRFEYYKEIENAGIIVKDSINPALRPRYYPIKAIECNVIDTIDDHFRELGYKLSDRLRFQEDYNLVNYIRAILSI